MKKVLIVSAHDTVVDSVANKFLLEDLHAKLPEAVFDDLDAQYADFQFDVKAEQKKMEEADIIVLQFPLYWYAMPALMQRWMEQTFLHGWAFGSTGTALQGKTLIASFTTGAPEAAYAHDGFMRHEIPEYFYNLECTCILTGMNWGGMVFTYGVSYADRKPENEGLTREKMVAHADRLIAKLNSI